MKNFRNWMIRTVSLGIFTGTGQASDLNNEIVTNTLQTHNSQNEMVLQIPTEEEAELNPHEITPEIMEKITKFFTEDLNSPVIKDSVELNNGEITAKGYYKGTKVTVNVKLKKKNSFKENLMEGTGN